MRGAVIDVGSYTFHAIVADVDEYGIRRVIFDHKTYDRTDESLHDLVQKTRARGPSELRVIATCDDFAGERISGEDQARLTWLGVSTELACSHGELAVIDLGGRSLELATGSGGADHVASLPLGVLELAWDTARARVIELAMPVADEIRARRPDTIAITSGTARALVRLGRRLGMIGDLQRHVGSRTFADLARRLGPLDANAMATLGVPASRRATLGAGAVAIATVLDLLGRPVVYIASSAMREGALVEIARRSRANVATMSRAWDPTAVRIAL
jgi:exopolyphosphatase/guanosine-5'-triphosphate,3'-diphosphate pyrophosphatase